MARIKITQAIICPASKVLQRADNCYGCKHNTPATYEGEIECTFAKAPKLPEVNSMAMCSFDNEPFQIYHPLVDLLQTKEEAEMVGEKFRNQNFKTRTEEVKGGFRIWVRMLGGKR